MAPKGGGSKAPFNLTQGPRPRARFGNTTTANSKGMPATGKVKGGGLAAPNNAIGNRKNVQQGGKQGGTRPIVTGTKAPVGRMGGVTR